MMRSVAKGLVRIGLAQPVVVLAIYKHGRYTEEVSGDSPLAAGGSFTVLGKATRDGSFSSSTGRRLPIPSMIFLKHS